MEQLSGAFTAPASRASGLWRFRVLLRMPDITGMVGQIEEWHRAVEEDLAHLLHMGLSANSLGPLQTSAHTLAHKVDTLMDEVKSW